MTSVSGAGDSTVLSIDDDELAKFVFILVLDSRYHLVTTEVSKMTSRDFFQTLTADYNTHRGVLRRLFSIFVYSHCDFVQVSKVLSISFKQYNRCALLGSVVDFLHTYTVTQVRDTEVKKKKKVKYIRHLPCL